MDAVAQISKTGRLAAGTLSPQDIRSLLRALGQWGVAEEAGVSGKALDAYANRAQSAFQRVAQAA